MTNKIDESLLTCLYCGKKCQHLGSHLWHSHKVRAREYKKEFGLDYNQSLISQAIYEKKSQHWRDNKEKYLKHFEKLKQYQFKKGEDNHKTYYSRQTKEMLKENSKELLTSGSGICPICKMKYQALASHLFNKHGLVQVKKEVK